MLFLSIPLARAGQTEAPPPVQMIRFLEDRHPPGERSRVWLLSADGLRQARWYGSAFQVSVARPYGIDREGLRTAVAIYTDTTNLALRGQLAGARLEPVATFTRSPLVYPKHARVELCRVVRSDHARDPITLP
jgi:hypothetical protein